MADHLGSFNASSTIYFYFTTHAASGAAVAPSSAFEAADLKIYKNGSATERTSASGITMTSPFDSVTGLHAVAIDLSDNTDASFYAAGSEYVVVLSPDETVDSLAVVKVLAYFSIERVVKVNVTQFGGSAGTFASGRPDVNMTYIAGSAVSTSSAQLGVNVVNFGGSAGTFASGRPEVNTSHIAGSSVSTSSAQIGVNVVNAGGTAWGSGAITAGSIAADAITDAKVASDVTIASVTGAVGSVTGAVGSVTGAVGSVTGNVGGNVTGSVGSVVGAVASVTARVTANTDQLAGQTVTAAAGVTFPTSVASPTNITAGTITTVTNLTNAATAGDFTSTMKTSIGTAVAASAVASVTGAVGSVTGNVGGNVTGSVGSVVGAVGSVTGAVGSVTGNVGGNVTGSVGSLATQAKADVNTEVVDALATDTYAEPGQGTPAATLSLSAKIGYLFKAWRNKSTQTSTAYNLFNDDAATVDQKATASDDGTTFSRGEISTGP